MEELLQRTDYEDGSYVDMRTKTLIVWSYVDEADVKLSPAEQKYALANPPTRHEIACLQAAMQDPSIKPGEKAQHAIEKALSDYPLQAFADALAEVEGGALDERTVIEQLDAIARWFDKYKGDIEQQAEQTGNSLQKIADAILIPVTREDPIVPKHEHFFADTTGKYVLVIGEAQCDDCRLHSNRVYYAYYMHELYGYPKDTGLFHPNCKCRAVSSVESWKEKWDAAAQAKVVEKQIAAQTRKEANERAEWILDAIQAALDWTGPAGDITNAILYAARGQYDQATLSLASALVPLSITGWGKLAEGTVDAGKYQKLAYGIDTAMDAGKQVNLESAGGIIEGVDETGGIELDKRLLQELAESEKKYNADDVVGITKMPDGKLVWLENGNSDTGLNHIRNHANDFAAQGIQETEIADYVMEALENGKVIGYQGKGTGRPIYEFNYDGALRRVAITIGNNGYVVGANPVSIK